MAALLAKRPAHQVAAIAARSDVQGVLPNRLAARTASALELATGALTTSVRTSNSGNGNGYTGLDGTGHRRADGDGAFAGHDVGHAA